MTLIGEVLKSIFNKKPEVHFIGDDDAEIDIVKEQGTRMYVVNLVRTVASHSTKDTRTTHLEGKPSPNHKGWSKKSRRYNNINTQ